MQAALLCHVFLDFSVSLQYSCLLCGDGFTFQHLEVCLMIIKNQINYTLKKDTPLQVSRFSHTQAVTL